jgi:hypothetical protein
LVWAMLIAGGLAASSATTLWLARRAGRAR